MSNLCPACEKPIQAIKMDIVTGHLYCSFCDAEIIDGSSEKKEKAMLYEVIVLGVGRDVQDVEQGRVIVGPVYEWSKDTEAAKQAVLLQHAEHIKKKAVPFQEVRVLVRPFGG